MFLYYQGDGVTKQKSEEAKTEFSRTAVLVETPYDHEDMPKECFLDYLLPSGQTDNRCGGEAEIVVPSASGGSAAPASGGGGTSPSVTPENCASINTGRGGSGVTGAIGVQSADELTALICKPQPRIRIPGLSFTDADDFENLLEFDDVTGHTYLNIPFLGEYLSAVYKYAVAAASIIALLVIIVSSIQWMSPGNIVTSVLTKVGGAKKKKSRPIKPKKESSVPSLG